MNILAELLSSKLRAEIFRILFGTNDTALHMREIQRQSGFSIGAIQSELKKLMRLDLVKKRIDGNRTYFSANKNHPIFNEIHHIVLKSVGLYDVLRNALKEQGIHIAFVYGSFAGNRENAGSDIDLLVIGDIGLRQLAGILAEAQEEVQREINPIIFGKKEFKKRVEEKDHLISSILTEPKIFIIGNDFVLRKLAGERLAAGS